MREPNLEEVLECLADIGEECQSVEKDTDLLDYILKRKNFDRDLWQILYYCQEERVNTFEKGICDIKDKQHRKKIVDSIIMLYPVTKNVINRMMRKRSISLTDCLEVVELYDPLIVRMKDSLQEMQKNRNEESSKISSKLSELDEIQKEIDQLNEQKGEIIKQIKDYDKKKAEKQKLEEEIQEIEKKGGIDQEISNLREKKKSLQKENAEKEKEKNELKKEITEIEKHLQPSKKETKDQKYLEALKALQNCIKCMSDER